MKQSFLRKTQQKMLKRNSFQEDVLELPFIEIDRSRWTSSVPNSHIMQFLLGSWPSCFTMPKQLFALLTLSQLFHLPPTSLNDVNERHLCCFSIRLVFHKFQLQFPRHHIQLSLENSWEMTSISTHSFMHIRSCFLHLFSGTFLIYNVFFFRGVGWVYPNIQQRV